MSARLLLAALAVGACSLRLGGAEPRRLDGMSGGTARIVFSPDGKLIAAPCGDGVVYLWDPATGKPVRKIENTQAHAWSVAFSPDGKTLAVPTNSGPINLYDVASGKLLRTLEGHTSIPWSVDFTPGGKLVSAGSEGCTKVWDTTKGKELASLTSDKVPGPWAVACSPDGRTVAVGSSDGAVGLWDIEGNELRVTFKAHDGGIWPLTFSPDGRTLATKQWQGDKARLWEVSTGTLRRELSCGPGSSWALAFTADGRRLLGTTLIDIRTQKDQALGKGEGLGAAVAASPDGRWLAQTQADGSIVVYDATAYPLPRRRAEPLKDDQLRALLTSIRENDGEKVYDALWALSGSPEQVLPLLQNGLEPPKRVEIDARKVEEHIKDLDSNRFATRQKATDALREMGPAVVPLLRKALGGDPPAEVRRRLEEIIAKWDTSGKVSRDEVRLLRTLEAVEMMGTPEALKFLDEAAKAHSGRWLGDEAKRSAERLRRAGAEKK